MSTQREFLKNEVPTLTSSILTEAVSEIRAKHGKAYFSRRLNQPSSSQSKLLTTLKTRSQSQRIQTGSITFINREQDSKTSRGLFSNSVASLIQPVLNACKVQLKTNRYSDRRYRMQKLEEQLVHEENSKLARILSTSIEINSNPNFMHLVLLDQI